MHRYEDHIAYFIADLHLASSRPELCAAFFDLLPKIAEDATDLFILGDFFNFWVGDDVLSPFTIKVAEELSKLTEQGINVYFQHGNRDFAVGENYAKLCKMSILPEIYTLPFAPDIIVLHGDQLCLADVKYQRYRKIIRNPFVLKCLHLLPKSVRLRIGLRLRETSKKAKRHTCIENQQCYCDVTNSAVEAILVQYSANIMLHGHTHKPNIHEHQNGTRWVLSDWEQTGDYIKWDKNNGLTRHTFTIPPVESFS